MLSEQVSFSWETVELPADKPMAVRDLFAQEDLGTFTGTFSALVNPHGVKLVRLSAA